MSASVRPTRRPCMCRATARLAATVDLPTPPLPLATAITCFTPGRAIFGGIGVCIGVPSGSGLAELAEDFEGVDAGVVAVVPVYLLCVPADRLHGDRGRRAVCDLA